MDTIRISTFHCPPFMILNEELQPIDGIEHFILEYLTRNYQKVIYNTSKAVNINPYSKIENDIINNISDIGSCSLYLKYSTDRSATAEHSMSCLTFLVPKPNIKEVNLITAALTTETCVVTIVTVFLIATIFKLFSKCLHFECDYLKCLLDMWRILLSGSILMSYLTKISRILLISWYFFSILMATGSSTGMTTMLTSVIYTDRVKTVDDLITKGINWGDYGYDYNDGNSKLSLLRETVTSRNDSISRLVRGDYAILVKRIGNDYITDTETISTSIRRKLVVMQECFRTNELVFYIRRNYSSLNQLNSDISNLKEHGFIKYWYDKTLMKYANKTEMQPFFVTNYQTKAVPLTLTKMQGIFYVLCGAHIINIIVFMLELLSTK